MNHIHIDQNQISDYLYLVYLFYKNDETSLWMLELVLMKVC